MSDDRTVPAAADRADASDRMPSRRALLATIGTAAVGGVAGCGGEDDGTATPAGTSTHGGTPTADGTPTARETTDAGESTATGTDPATPAAVSEGGPPDDAGWSLTFRDAFDAGELDWDTWEVGFGPYNDHHCAAAACARRSNVHVDAETERLVLTTTEGAEDVPNSTWLADYTTGAVTTGTSFSQTFGYFEAKARLPVQPGALPAFWAWSEDGNPPEIDFYEVFGAEPRTITTTVHVGCGEEDAIQGSGQMTELDDRVDERFHVVGCEWAPDHVAWFVDGREVYRVDGPLYDNCHEPEPLFPVLNTHVGGREGDFVGPDVVGDPTAAEYPYTHEFEWVRVWQRDAWE